MNKRALLLTAAAAALLSGPAFAQCTISSKTTTAQDTKTCDGTGGTITITTTGSVVVSGNPPTGPAITIDGNATGGAADVINEGTISYLGSGSASNPFTGIDMVTGFTGGLDNAGTIDFTGTGTNKTGIAFTGTGTFTGDITQTSGGQTLVDMFGTAWTFDAPNTAAILLESGSKLRIQGDNSIGIDIASGATVGASGALNDIDIAGAITMLPSSSSSTASASTVIEIAGTMYGNINELPGGSIDLQGNGSSNGIYIPALSGSTPAGQLFGDINIDGTLQMAPVSATSTTATGNVAINIGGALNGNLNIGTSGNIVSTGSGAEGVFVSGNMTGYIDNQGTLQTIGTNSPAPKGNNPQAGSALYIAGSVNGGIFNAGPSAQGSTTPNATISSQGVSAAVTITPSSNATSSLVIGTYTGPQQDGDVASILNRGTIETSSENPDVGEIGISLNGTSSSVGVDLTQGIFNAGTISAATVTDTHASGITGATGILVGDYVYLPGITNSNEDSSKPGDISASISGQAGGFATAILFDPFANGGTGGSGMFILNQGVISATASSTNGNLVNGALKATAIQDLSGLLDNITNASGALIEALATPLSDYSQQTVAIDVQANTTGVTVTNNGSIIGDIKLGSGSDVVNVTGNSPSQPASLSGSIWFGGNSGADDTLIIGQNGSVTGELFAGTTTNPTAGEVDVELQTGGTLDLLSQVNVNPKLPLQAATGLNAGNFDTAANSTLTINLWQGFDINEHFQNLVPPVINAEKEATIADNTTVNIKFSSFIYPVAGFSDAQFIVLAAPAGNLNLTGTELAAIQQNFQNTLSYIYSPAESGVTLNGAMDELLVTMTPKTIGADGCKTQQVVNNCNPNHIPLGGYAAQMFPYANVALENDNLLGAAVLQGVTNAFTANQTYSNFAPDVSGATRALAVSLTDEATNVVAARQRTLREYANQEGDLTLWGQQFDQRLNQDDTNAAGAGYVDNGFGFVLGMDEGDPVDGRYGAAITFFNGDDREKPPRQTKTTSEWFMLTGYTDWRGNHLFLDTQATVGYVNLKGQRYMDLQVQNNGFQSTFQRIAQSQYPGEYLAGGATTGAIFDEDGTVIMPELGLDGLVMRQEQYSESGGGSGFDLHVASAYSQSVRAFTGVDVRQDLDFTDFLLQPDIRAGYRYDFANGAQELKGNFISVQSPTQIFDITGPKPSKGNAVAGGGIGVSTGAWSINLGFDYLRASSGNTSEEGTITLLGRI